MKKNNNTTIRNFALERAQKLSEIGAHLRQVRLQEEITLQEVADFTKIRLPYVRAIEEGKLDQLPEPIYIQGFMRRIADALGLNGAELVKDFPIESNLKLLAISWINLPTPQLRPFHLYALYILVIMFSVNGLSSMMNRAATQQANSNGNGNPASPSLPAGSQVQAANAKEIVNSVRTASTSTSGDAKGPVRVGLTLKAESWIQVVADGKIAFEGQLPEGTQRTWEANQQLIVRAGNAGGVLVAVNDGQAKQMGKVGEVEEVTFKADNTKS
jgi:cytoskeletal protein RodZ